MEEVADLPDEVFGFGNWLLWLVATRATALVDQLYHAGPARPSRTYGQVAGHPVPTPSLVAWLLAASELGLPIAGLDPRDAFLSGRQKSLRTVVSRAVKGEPRLFKDAWLGELADICGFKEPELRFLLRNRDDEGHPIDPAGLRKAIAATFEQRDAVGPPLAPPVSAAGGAGVAAGAGATRTLPADVPSFTGRQRELDRLKQALPADSPDPGVVKIAIIDGMAGVGKTAFAVHAAHQLARHFPDGQIFVSLHGHNPGQRPADPSDVLCALLLEDGVAPEQMPADSGARAALWRNRLAGRSILLLLDDAIDSEQVRPLLPGSGRALVLITSRRKLTALPHAQALPIEVLNAADAGELFVRLADRPGLLPDGTEVADIARSCGYLPLGISLVAGQLKHHAAWTAADLAGDLASSAGRLRLMAAEGLSVTAALELSYRSLRPDLQRLFRRLSLLPGADFDAYAGAAADDADPVVTGERLDELFRYHLITEPVRGRYRFHDLIAEHARTLAAADPAAECDDARVRLLGYYLRTAQAASRYLSRVTHTGTGSAGIAGPPAPGPAMSTWHDAIGWMEAEHQNLHAAAEYAAACQQPRFATAIPCAINGYLLSRGRWSEGIVLHGLALKVARATGDRAAEACALSDVGHLQYLTGKTRAATAILTRAAELQRRLGSPLGEANATLRLGCVHLATGENQAALERIESAQELFREVGDRLGYVAAVYYLGIERYLTGQYRDSAQALATALEMYRSLGILSGQADALSYLGAVQHATGRSEAAAANLEKALRIYRDIGDRREEAGALYFLGAVRREASDLSTSESAMATLAEALRLYRDFGDQFGEAGVLNQIGLLQTAAGDYQQARRTLNQALRIYRRYDSRAGEAEVSNSLGELALATGELTEALACHRAALAITTQTADQLEEARAREGLGLGGIRAGQIDEGMASLREAMTIYRRIGSPRLRRVERLVKQELPAATSR